MENGVAEGDSEDRDRPLDIEHLFQELDGNKDGRLDRRELEVTPLCSEIAMQLLLKGWGLQPLTYFHIQMG